VLCFAAWPVSAQLPPSGTLSDNDWPLFRAAVAQLEQHLSTTTLLQFNWFANIRPKGAPHSFNDLAFGQRRHRTGKGSRAVPLCQWNCDFIRRRAPLCLDTIDGLYFHGGSLIAIQNAFMTPRVARFHLSRDLRSIARFEVLERGDPLFDGVSTGVIDGDDFYYMANRQDDRKTGFDPIVMLKTRL
jgi:hypothetical protein